MAAATHKWWWADDANGGHQNHWVEYDQRKSGLLEAAFQAKQARVDVDAHRFVQVNRKHMYQARKDAPDRRRMVERREGDEDAEDEDGADDEEEDEDDDSASAPPLQQSSRTAARAAAAAPAPPAAAGDDDEDDDDDDDDDDADADEDEDDENEDDDDDDDDDGLPAAAAAAAAAPRAKPTARGAKAQKGALNGAVFCMSGKLSDTVAVSATPRRARHLLWQFGRAFAMTFASVWAQNLTSRIEQGGGKVAKSVVRVPRSRCVTATYRNPACVQVMLVPGPFADERNDAPALLKRRLC
jgi:hypothetical protein